MKFTQKEFEAACKAGRQAVDATGFGSFVSDAKVTTVVEQVLKAIEDVWQEEKK